MRVKVGSYAFRASEKKPRMAAILNINADEVSRHEKIISIDYWGPEFKKAAREKNNFEQTEENEDRIISDKSELKPLKKYVNEIHVFVPFSSGTEKGVNEYLVNQIIEINEYAKNSSYPPIYFYLENESAYKSQQKSKALRNLDSLNIKPIEIKDPYIPRDRTSEPTPLDALISIVDGESEQKFSSLFPKYPKEATSQYERSEKLLKYYHRDALASFSCEAHNLRADHHPVLQKLSQAIRKAKKKDLLDFVKYAIELVTSRDTLKESTKPTSYKEIEFVCYNSDFPDSTSEKSQLNLYNDLRKLIPSIHPYIQDFSESGTKQKSLAVIITDKQNEEIWISKIKSLAKKHGVKIDLINELNPKQVDDRISIKESSSRMGPKITEMFTAGGCQSFALQLHELTGWPMFGEFEKGCKPSFETLRHAWVVNDDGNAVDISGIHDGNYARTKYSDPTNSGDFGKVVPIKKGQFELPKNNKKYSVIAKEIIKRYPERFGLE